MSWGLGRGGSKMINRRSEVEIVREILGLNGVGKTEIMYSVNLSHIQLNRYLDFLTKRGLIRREVGRARIPLYFATDKGKSLIPHMDSVLEGLGVEVLS